MMVWLEWIDSESNLADGISRHGIRDEIALAAGVPVLEFSLPDLGELLFGSVARALAATSSWTTA